MSHISVEHLPIQDILKWLLREREPVAELDSATGERRLTYSRKFLWTTTIVVILANGAFGFMLALMRDDVAALIPSLGIFGLMWLAAMIGAWDAFLTKISFTSEGIFLERASGSRAFVPWSAVYKVRYSRLGSWFSFRAPGLPTVRVSIYRSGLLTFAESARRGMAENPAGQVPSALFEKARNP